MTTAATERVCFVGAGTMGCANSLVSAVAGHRVRVYDVSDEALERVPDRYEEIGRFLLAVGYCSAADVAAGRDRITLTTDLEAATADADLVSESVFERLDLKRDVHARLDRVCPTHTILTTNTSVLLVSDIEDVVARGDRFAALHSHLASLLVDIVGGPRTSPATIDTLRSYVLGLGATPLVLKREHRGYVVNALVGSLLTAAMRLHVEHGLTIHDVDRAWMVGRRTPMGPFGMIDLFGTDVVLESWTRDEEDGVRRELAARIVPPLRALVDAGRLGQKTGAGFYRYPAPEYQEPGFLDDAVSTEVGDALTTALVLGALALVEADVADPDDIDHAWTAATLLDAGPLAIADRTGTLELRRALDRQIERGLAEPADHRLLDVYDALARSGTDH